MFSLCGFECLRKFLRIFVMFGNDELSKLVLIISDSSDSVCFAATFIELIWSVYYYNGMFACASERMVKDWWGMVLNSLTNKFIFDSDKRKIIYENFVYF